MFRIREIENGEKKSGGHFLRYFSARCLYVASLYACVALCVALCIACVLCVCVCCVCFVCVCVCSCVVCVQIKCTWQQFCCKKNIFYPYAEAAAVLCYLCPKYLRAEVQKQGVWKNSTIRSIRKIIVHLNAIVKGHVHIF